MYIHRLAQDIAWKAGLHLTRAGFGRRPFKDIDYVLSKAGRTADADLPLTIFDVGANRGQSVDYFVRMWNQAEIYAFEPSPKVFGQLAKLHGQTANVHLENSGLGSQEGTLILQENSSSDMSSFLKLGTKGWGSVIGQTEVNVTTLDCYLHDHGIDQVDLLKIDTQGFDFEVLKGAEKTISKKAISVIKMEAVFESLYEATPSWMEPIRFLEDYGYRMMGIYDFFYRRSPNPIQADMVMVEESLLGKD